MSAVTYHPSVASESYLTRYIPLITPAIDSREPYKQDDSLLFKRMAIVFSVAMAFILSSAFLPMYELALVFTGIAICFIPLLDVYFASRAIDWNAAVSYRDDPIPSSDARIQLMGSTRAVHYLLKMKGDVNKKDETGNRILDGIQYKVGIADFNKEVVRLLCKNGYAFGNTEKGQLLHFLKICVEARTPDLIKLLIDEKVISPQTLTPEQQVMLWTRAGSLRTLSLLKKAGFDPNVLNPNTGFTPLAVLIQKKGLNRYYSSSEIDFKTYIRALVQCGANPQTLTERHGDKPSLIATLLASKYYLSDKVMKVVQVLLDGEYINLNDLNVRDDEGRTPLQKAYQNWADGSIYSKRNIETLRGVGATITLDELRKIFSANVLICSFGCEEQIIHLAECGIRADQYSDKEQWEILRALTRNLGQHTSRAIHNFGLNPDMRSPKNNWTLLFQVAHDNQEGLDEEEEKLVRVLLELGADSKAKMERQVEIQTSIFHRNNFRRVERVSPEQLCPEIADIRRELEEAKS